MFGGTRVRRGPDRARLQEAARTHPEQADLRVGLALGPVLVRFGDLFGEAVNLARG
ncbi:hypothetical protein GS905_06280 [Rhodococcus hoagii]|nr:hypothetical protein [Prescottella equi]